MNPLTTIDWEQVVMISSDNHKLAVTLAGGLTHRFDFPSKAALERSVEEWTQSRDTQSMPPLSRVPAAQR